MASSQRQYQPRKNSFTRSFGSASSHPPTLLPQSSSPPPLPVEPHPGRLVQLDDLDQCGPYTPAPLFLDKGVDLRENISELDGEELPFYHSNIMPGSVGGSTITSQTDDQVQESRLILQKLLQDECELPAEERSVERLARLHQKMGTMNLQLGSLQQAIRYLTKSIDGLKVVDPIPTEDIIDATRDLIRALRLNQDFDKAQVYAQWLQRDIEPRLSIAGPDIGPPPRVRSDSTAELPAAFDWCKRKGFNVDGPIGFRFEEWDRKCQNSPIHLAVQEENASIVRIMADHVVSLDRGPDFGWPTPLLCAASTRDRDTVSILMDRGARVDIRDRAGRTCLHRCQGRSGGVQVAEMFLNKWPEMLNDVDSSGKTALFMAVEMGNEKMVQFLLGRNADPNISYLPQGTWATSVLSTPLIAAIDLVATKAAQNIRVVEQLLVHGADPQMRSGDGRDAMSAANNAGLASRELKTLLKRYKDVQVRRCSNASVSTTYSRSSSNTASGNGHLRRSKFSG